MSTASVREEKRGFLTADAVMAAAQAVAMGTPEGGKPDSVQEQLMALLLKRLQKDEQKEQDEMETIRKMQKQGAETLRQHLRDQMAAQATCDHRKENGKSRVVGQRNHKHQTILLCQACLKVWVDGIDEQGQRIASMLVPPAGDIGGPTQ